MLSHVRQGASDEHELLQPLLHLRLPNSNLIANDHIEPTLPLLLLPLLLLVHQLPPVKQLLSMKMSPCPLWVS